MKTVKTFLDFSFQSIKHTFVFNSDLQTFSGPALRMNETFDRQSYFRLASPAGLNSTFSREPAAAAAQRLLNSTFDQSQVQQRVMNSTFDQGQAHQRVMNSTFDQSQAQFSATFHKDESPIGAATNATYGREDSSPGMSATYRKDSSVGANGTFRKDSGVNTTYQKGDSPSSGNATYRKDGSMSSGNATFDMRPSSAVNSTFDIRQSGNLLFLFTYFMTNILLGDKKTRQFQLLFLILHKIILDKGSISNIMLV